MLPAAFVVLDALPLSRNGKVDRKALPKPEAQDAALAEDYRPPESDLEQQIAALWQEVLQIESVGIDNNFFDMGGHSLLMARLHARLQEALKVQVAIVDLFQYPTVRTLAAYLGRGTAQEPEPIPGGDRQAIRDRQRRSRDKLRASAQHQETEDDDF
jgi:acyl carrier protein